jgi:hypothetical protein
MHVVRDLLVGGILIFGALVGAALLLSFALFVFEEISAALRRRRRRRLLSRIETWDADDLVDYLS